MYNFSVQNGMQCETYHISIERKTNLLVLEWDVEGEEFPRYIRMTGQQINRLRDILFCGDFTSATIPHNRYSLSNGIVTMRCAEEGQTITMALNGIKNVWSYYEKHKDHIAKYDLQFKSRR